MCFRLIITAFLILNVDVSLAFSDCPKVISNKKLPLCEGDSTVLTVSPTTSTAVYEWLLDGKPTGQFGSRLTVKKAGIYSVLITKNPCTTSDSLTVAVASLPKTSLTVSGSTKFCSIDTLILYAPKNNAYDYLWFYNNFPVVDDVGSDIKPRQSGDYYVIVTDSSGKCKAQSKTIKVEINQSPKVRLDSIPPLCAIGAQAVTLKGTPSGGTYSGQGMVGNRFISLNMPTGEYPVTYNYTTSEGCSGKASRIITILPAVKFQLHRNWVILKGESIKVETNIPEKNKVTWSPATGLDDARSPNPTARPTETTTYKLTIETPEKCSIESDLKITVIELDIFNGLTPNADGINDFWEIGGIEKYPNTLIEVYNRWGNNVFRTLGYQNKWDGTLNGEALPAGVYYYQIKLRDLDYNLSGELTIIK